MAPASKPSAKAITAPKGRPTRARRSRGYQRTFGSTFQWTAAAVGLIAVMVVVYLVAFR